MQETDFVMTELRFPFLHPHRLSLITINLGGNCIEFLSFEKVYRRFYCRKFRLTASAVSCIKPNTNQWKAMLYDDVGIPTVNRRIYRCKFFALSNQTSCYIRKCIRIYCY